MEYNVLVLGSGGRESALAWSLSKSDLCSELHVLPGNGGTRAHFPSADLDILDFKAVEGYCTAHSIDIIVVGPEQPLTEGIVDYFEAKEILIFGPSKKAAQLEGSKRFAKDFMQEFNVPTASMFLVTESNLAEGIEYIRNSTPPYVLKADGLAAGKGVIIESDADKAIAELRAMIGGKFGSASSSVLIEQFLDGIEFSVFVLTDGEDYKILPIAKDYKRIGEGDTGLNTGGMGAVSPVSFIDDSMMALIEEKVVRPTIAGIKNRGMSYKGVVFIGLIKVDDKPYVIEYNCRFGDPETEAILPRVQSDLLDLVLLTSQSKLDTHPAIEVDDRVCLTVILASGGYPESYQKGKTISNAEQEKDVLVFHAGTKRQDGSLLTSGGRVIAVSALGSGMDEALVRAYKKAEDIHFDGKYFRKDIGQDLL